MNNLLPQNARSAVRHIYVSRLAFVVTLGCIAFSFVAIAVLLPSYVFTLTREQVVKDKFANIQTTETAKLDSDIRKILNDSRSKTESIWSSLSSAKILPTIKKIIDVKQGSITVTSFDIGKITEGKRRVGVEGIAKNREALVSFSKELEKVKDFADVNVPITNFQKSSDIPFTISFNIVH